MGNFFGDIGKIFTGSDSSAKSFSSLSSAQQAVASSLGTFLESFTEGLPFGGDLTADMSRLFEQAFDLASSRFGQAGDIAFNAATKQVQGVPAFQFDEGRTSRRFQEGFAVPLMETFRNTIAPFISESFAGIPGAFRSRDRGNALGFGAEDFARRNIIPRQFEAFQADEQRAFESGEAAAARVPDAISQLTSLPGQEFATFAGIAETERAARQLPLMAQLQEYRNLLSSALGFSTTPTQDTAVFQGQQSQLGPMLLALAAL